MKISGFTIVRNAQIYNYPVLESIRSLLPLCDELIVNVGDSEDATLELIQSLKDQRIKIIQSRWDMSLGEEVLAQETNKALAQCRGDWAFYLQSDEVLHQDDLPYLRKCMEKYLHNPNVEVLRLRWLHFYGSYYRYRIDHGWFQKNDRVIKNNGQIESYGDAGGFRRKDAQPLKRKLIHCLLYHYGWVHSEEMMAKRRWNAQNIGFAKLQPNEKSSKYHYGNLSRFPAYFGTHPSAMKERIESHSLSQEDWKNVSRHYWYHFAKILRMRYKTFKRIKYKIEV